MDTESNSISFGTGISARLGQVPGQSAAGKSCHGCTCSLCSQCAAVHGAGLLLPEPGSAHSEAHCANRQTDAWVDKSTCECCQHLRLDS